MKRMLNHNSEEKYKTTLDGKSERRREEKGKKGYNILKLSEISNLTS